MSKKNKKNQKETQSKQDLQLAKEVATRNVAEFISGLDYLPNPDTILSKNGGNIKVYREMVDAHLDAVKNKRFAAITSRPWTIDGSKGDEKKGGIDYMLGGGSFDRSKNPNSYPQTSDEKHPSNLKVFVGGRLVKEMTLADDPADHRGILSWLSQPHDGLLREAGSYGYLVTAPVAASAVKDGKVTVLLEADDGLAVYGPKFGRYPFGPHVK